MLNYELPGKLNAVMFSRHLLGCDVVFVKIRSVLLFELSPVQIAQHFHVTDMMMISELYFQFVTINPFMLQIVQVLLSNKVIVIPYEYENEYINKDAWDELIIKAGYPKLAPAFIFPKEALKSNEIFIQYVKEDDKIGFISSKPLSLAKAYLYPFRVYPNLSKMPYSYRAIITNKQFQFLYDAFVNQTLLHGVSPMTKAYALGYAKIGPLHYMLCKIIYQKIKTENFDRVYFLPRAYLLFLCYQKFYCSPDNAIMLNDRIEGSKVLFVDFEKDKSQSQKTLLDYSHLTSDKAIELFEWKVSRKYRIPFTEMMQLLSNMPFALTDHIHGLKPYLPYPESYIDNMILCDIYKGVVEFVDKFHQFIPEFFEENLGSFHYKDGFQIYMQDLHKKKKSFSFYGWLKKNKLVRRVYSFLKRRISD